MSSSMSTAPFTFDFETKSLPSITESGDLIIRGLASEYAEDRVGDVVEPGALSAALDDFMRRSALLCWEHDRKLPIGRILEAQVTKKGLEIVARVDKPVAGDVKRLSVFEMIRRGTIRSLSIGGIFRRMGNRIRQMDLLEISAVGVPAARGTTFEVVAVKAFDQPTSVDPLAAVERTVSLADLALATRRAELARLELEVLSL